LTRIREEKLLRRNKRDLKKRSDEMDCKTARQILALYAGADIDDPEAQMLRRHIASCSRCAKLLESYRANIALLTDLKEEEAPAGTFENFYTDLRERIVCSGALAWRRRNRVIVTALRAATVAAVILIAVFIWFTAERQQERPKQTLPSAKSGVVNVEKVETVEQITEEVLVPREKINGVEMEECELLSESSGSSDF
jgi:hypothetical protein